MVETKSFLTEEVDLSKNPYNQVSYRPQNKELLVDFDAFIKLVGEASTLQDFRSAKKLTLQFMELLEKCETKSDLEDIETLLQEFAKIDSYGEELFQKFYQFIALRKKDIPELPKQVSRLAANKKDMESEYFKISIQTENVALALRIRALLTALSLADIKSDKENELLVSAQFINALGFCQEEEELECVRTVLEEASKMGGIATPFYQSRKDLLTMDGLRKIKEKFGQRPNVKVDVIAHRKVSMIEESPIEKDYSVEKIPDSPPVALEQPIAPLEEEKKEDTVITKEKEYALEDLEVAYQRGMDFYFQMMGSHEKRVDQLEELFYLLRKLITQLESTQPFMDQELFMRRYKEVEEAIRTIQSLYLQTTEEIENFDKKYRVCLYDFFELLESKTNDSAALEEIQIRLSRLQQQLKDLETRMSKKTYKKYEEELEDIFHKMTRKKEMDLVSNKSLDDVEPLVY